MSGSLSMMGWLMVQVPALLAQWLGMVLLAKSGRGPGWWCLLAGALFGSFSFVATAYFYIVFTSSPGIIHSPEWLLVITSGGGVLGGLLFMVGFALHAAGHLRAVERAKELEQLCAAMAEEANRKATAAGGVQG